MNTTRVRAFAATILAILLVLMPLQEISTHVVYASPSLLATAATIAAIGAARGAFTYAMRVSSDSTISADCADFLTEVSVAAATTVASSMIMAWKLQPNTLFAGAIAGGVTVAMLSSVDMLALTLEGPIREALSRSPICGDLGIACGDSTSHALAVSPSGIGMGTSSPLDTIGTWLETLNYAGYYAYFTANNMISFLMEVLGMLFDFSYLESQMSSVPMGATQIVDTMNIDVFEDVRNVSATYRDYETSIPPEVLAGYLPGVVSGDRPTRHYLTVDEIWQLRDAGFSFAADFLDISQLPLADLSTSQREILEDYVSAGGTLLVEDSRLYDLFQTKTGYMNDCCDRFIIKDDVEHPIHEGCSDAEWHYRSYYVRTADCDMCYEYTMMRGSLAGVAKIGFGAGHVIFLGQPVLSEDYRGSGNDRNRLHLNLIQWLLGGAIPREGFRQTLEPSFSSSILFDVPEASMVSSSGRTTAEPDQEAPAATQEPEASPPVSIAPVSQRLSDLESRVDVLESGEDEPLEAVAVMLESLGSDLSALSERVHALESESQVSSGGVQEEQVAALAKELARVQLALHALETRIEVLEIDPLGIADINMIASAESDSKVDSGDSYPTTASDVTPTPPSPGVSHMTGLLIAVAVAAFLLVLLSGY